MPARSRRYRRSWLSRGTFGKSRKFCWDTAAHQLDQVSDRAAGARVAVNHLGCVPFGTQQCEGRLAQVAALDVRLGDVETEACLAFG